MKQTFTIAGDDEGMDPDWLLGAAVAAIEAEGGSVDTSTHAATETTFEVVSVDTGTEEVTRQNVNAATAEDAAAAVAGTGIVIVSTQRAVLGNLNG